MGPDTSTASVESLRDAYAYFTRPRSGTHNGNVYDFEFEGTIYPGVRFDEGHQGSEGRTYHSLYDHDGNLVAEEVLSQWPNIKKAFDEYYSEDKIWADSIKVYQGDAGLRRAENLPTIEKNVDWGMPDLPKVQSTVGLKIKIIEADRTD